MSAATGTDAWREAFPVVRNAVYFNHAAVGPLSIAAAAAMERHARDQREFGALHWRDWYAEHAALRVSAARMIGCEASEIAIVKNTSEGISFIAGGIRWRQGDNVVTTAVEFPSNSVPWRRLAGRGVECRIAALPEVAHVEPLIDSRTRVVTVSSVAFHDGYAADLKGLGELCSARGIRFCVDAIQSLGVLSMDVRAAKIDFLAADGHKWMCGPEGAGLLYVAAERLEELEVLESGWTNIDRRGKFIDCSTDLLPDSRRFEAGSLNTNGVYGLRAAVDLLLDVGIDTVGRTAIDTASALADALEAEGWRIVSRRPLRSPIVGVIPAGARSIGWWHQRLEERGVVCAPREGMLRFSPHFYNDDAEVAKIAALARELRAQ